MGAATASPHFPPTWPSFHDFDELVVEVIRLLGDSTRLEFARIEREVGFQRHRDGGRRDGVGQLVLGFTVALVGLELLLHMVIRYLIEPHGADRSNRNGETNYW